MGQCCIGLCLSHKLCQNIIHSEEREEGRGGEEGVQKRRNWRYMGRREEKRVADGRGEGEGDDKSVIAILA